MAHDAALFDHWFDVVPVVNISLCYRFNNPIMWCRRAVTLFKLGTGIGSAAAKDKDCNDQANFSIYDFSFSLPLIRWESPLNYILHGTHCNDIVTLIS